MAGFPSVLLLLLLALVSCVVSVLGQTSPGERFCLFLVLFVGVFAICGGAGGGSVTCVSGLSQMLLLLYFFI